MRRFLFSAGVLAAALTVSTRSPAEDKAKADDKGWVQLFNGKDLTGWKMHPKANKDSKWEVTADGFLTGSGPACHLFSDRDDYENFHYRIEAKINDKGNSGQYFRTKFEPGFPTGYEAQLNATHADPVKTGSIYPAGGLAKYRKEITVLNTAPHKPDELFTQEVIADGDHIIIKVNDKVTVDWKDPENRYTKGHFALQHHDPTCKVMFKKIEVKELPASKK
jgi:hypothetical protein